MLCAVGGHKYAGNAIVFPIEQSSPCEWLGYLCPQDAPKVVRLACTGDVEVCV